MDMGRAGGRQRAQPRRNKAAALQLVKTLLKRQGPASTIIVTDKPGSYRAAPPVIGFSGQHEQGLRANNRAENASAAKRAQAARLQIGPSAQRFVSMRTAVYNVFNVQRHLISRAALHRFHAVAHRAWNDATAMA